jgi:hypothetical protein
MVDSEPCKQQFSYKIFRTNCSLFRSNRDFAAKLGMDSSTPKREHNDLLPEYEECDLLTTMNNDQKTPDAVEFYQALKSHMNRLYAFDTASTPKTKIINRPISISMHSTLQPLQLKPKISTEIIKSLACYDKIINIPLKMSPPQKFYSQLLGYIDSCGRFIIELSQEYIESKDSVCIDVKLSRRELGNKVEEIGKAEAVAIETLITTTKEEFLRNEKIEFMKLFHEFTLEEKKTILRYNEYMEIKKEGIVEKVNSIKHCLFNLPVWG